MSRSTAQRQPKAPLHWKAPASFALPSLVGAVLFGVTLSSPLHMPRAGRLVAAAILMAWLLYAVAHALRNRAATGESLLGIFLVGSACTAFSGYLALSAGGVSMKQRFVLSTLWLVVPAAIAFTNEFAKAARRQRSTAAQPLTRQR